MSADLIANFPKMLLVLLAVLTLLGAIMGYCLALIRTKRFARLAIDETRRKLKLEQVAAQADLRAAKRKIDLLEGADEQAPDDGESASERANELKQHSRRQAHRIKTLEAQLASVEQQQLNLQQDFAIYNARELALARLSSVSVSETENLPTLIRRVGPPAALPASASMSFPRLERPAAEQQWHKGEYLSNVLTPELDIPPLAESELPDLDDELEFDLTGAEDSAADWRG